MQFSALTTKVSSLEATTFLTPPLMTGYQPIDCADFKRYTLLDAEAKVKNPELIALEVRVNRRSSHDALAGLPIAAQWPLIPDEVLPEIVASQIQLAQQATIQLRTIPLKTRIQVLKEFGRRLRRNHQKWQRLTVQESYAHSAFVASLDAILQIFQPSYFDLIEEILAPSCKAGTPARIEHVPQGVIGVISPQNSSFAMLTQILHGAFLSGNALLIKPPHRAALVALTLAQDFNQVLQEYGMPDGLVSTIVHPHTPQVLNHWLGSPRIDNLIFVGNSKRRPEIVQACQQAGIFNPIIELEGVDAAYVHDDLSDEQLQLAAKQIAFAKNNASGQFCVSLRRLFVHPLIHDRLLNYLRQEFQQYRPGSLLVADPYILGPSSMAQKMSSIVQAFEQEGAIVATGGRRLNYAGEPDAEGIYIEPTLFDAVSPASHLLQEEIFANVLPVITTDGTVQQAIDLINHCNFGLRASIFVQNPQVIQTLRHQLKVGTVVINGNPLDFRIQIAGGRGASTLDQHARIWAIDLSLRQVVTGDAAIQTLESVLRSYDVAMLEPLGTGQLGNDTRMGALIGV
jgi:acyl-CoA reductase-like NAD-dependent aldehyde dehydrogenase